VRDAALPVLLGLMTTWGWIILQVGGRWTCATPVAARPEPERRAEGYPQFDRWQSTKGLTVAAVLVAIFLTTTWPRELAALAGAGVLLLSRRLHSRRMLGLVDWELLILFIGLFVVNRALETTHVPDEIMANLKRSGFDAQHPASLFVATFILSNIVSNVPAVMLLLPAAHGPLAGPLLALVST